MKHTTSLRNGKPVNSALYLNADGFECILGALDNRLEWLTYELDKNQIPREKLKDDLNQCHDTLAQINKALIWYVKQLENNTNGGQ